jgi:hypothetical protein
MTLVIPTDYINMSFGYAAEGDPELAYTSLGFQCADASDLGQLVLIAQSINDGWQLAMKAMTSTFWAMTGSFATIGTPTGPPYLHVDLAGTTTGEGNASATPNNCALLVKKSTATPGRPGRGRMYVPGLDANMAFVNGVINGADRVNWQDAIEEFVTIAQLVDGVEGLALFHDETSPVTVPSPIVGLTVATKIATQRRRMRP